MATRLNGHPAAVVLTPPEREGKNDAAIASIGCGCVVAMVAGVLTATWIIGAVLTAYAYAGHVGPWGMIVGAPCLVGTSAAVWGGVWAYRRAWRKCNDVR